MSHELPNHHNDHGHEHHEHHQHPQGGDNNAGNDMKNNGMDNDINDEVRPETPEHLGGDLPRDEGEDLPWEFYDPPSPPYEDDGMAAENLYWTGMAGSAAAAGVYAAAARRGDDPGPVGHMCWACEPPRPLPQNLVPIDVAVAAAIAGAREREDE